MKQLQLTGFYFLLAGQVLFAPQGRADSWQSAVSARVSSEFETNPAMSPAYPGSVWRAVVEPGYSLTGRAGENDLKAGLGLQFVRSTNKTLDPDRDSPAGFLEWLRQSDDGEIGITGRYAEVATRDSGIDATGRGPANSTRASRTVSGILSHRFTPRSTVAADGSYERVSFMGGNYVDYSMQSGGLKFSYAINETVTPFFTVSGIKYVPANDGPSSGLAGAMLGLNWKTRHTDWTLQAGAAKVDDRKAIPQGTVATLFTGERTELAMNAGRTVLPSGLGGFVKADQLRGSVRYALSARDNTGIDLERRRNFPVSLNNDRSQSTASDVWIDHDFSQFWKMRTYFRHWISQADGSERVASNILGISLAYNMPISNPNTGGDHD